MVSIRKLVVKVIETFGRFVIWIVDPILRWLYDGCHRGLPPVSDPLLMKSAVELSRMIRAKEVTSEEVVSAYISRTQEVNPYINVIVGNRFDAALKDAREVDRILASDNIPEKYSEKHAPFFGVPMTTKEAISIDGLPNTSGLLSRKTVLSSKDAAVIVAMRRAGAIPIAVTNVSELCMWYESSNLLYGRSNNPYHQGRMVGGSSGGEGSLQSSGGSAIGIGSDIGGSIRTPCFFNGIFGHKATTGVINNSGQFPCAKAGAVNFLSTAPMCRFACDLMPTFRILMSPDFQDQLKLDEQVDVTKLKYYYLEDDGGDMLISPVHPEIKEAVKKAADHFENLGCQTKKVSLAKMKYSFQFCASMMSNSGDETICNLLGNLEKPINPYVELLYRLVQFPRHTLPAIGLWNRREAAQSAGARRETEVAVRIAVEGIRGSPRKRRGLSLPHASHSCSLLQQPSICALQLCLRWHLQHPRPASHSWACPAMRSRSAFRLWAESILTA